MGEEISNTQFTREDFELFSERLREETRLLDSWLRDGHVAEGSYQAGFEMEAWLLDAKGRPLPCNEPFLARLNDPLAVPELAQFNFELNGHHRDLKADVFTRMHSELHKTWEGCRHTAAEMDADVTAIGTLPTSKPEDFCLANMSTLKRYRALNEQVLRMRAGRPLHIRIDGLDTLDFTHPDVMMEAATTSFQIHLRMPLSKTVRIYNAGKVLAAPMTALTANSPFLFGYNLWAESRIPVFEQAVMVGQSNLTKRVSFGIRYAQHSIMEIFESNLARYPIMLPRVVDDAPDKMSHLRLHNGTIWRWNRPLIGFDSDGSPHIRLEHRCVPSGPSLRDMIANAAFFYGLVCELAQQDTPMESLMPFEQAHQNFYLCARDGLAAQIDWPGKGKLPVRGLCLETLLPLAERGLRRLSIDDDEIFYWLSIIEARLDRGQNGAAWQRAWVARHGPHMQRLISAYMRYQQHDLPVHEWDLL